jgi:hypothetical protein
MISFSYAHFMVVFRRISGHTNAAVKCRQNVTFHNCGIFCSTFSCSLRRVAMNTGLLNVVVVFIIIFLKCRGLRLVVL